jgi:hypothetical protein
MSDEEPPGDAPMPITEEGIELVHPVYLDVPMMVNFLASAGGDVTFKAESTVTRTATQSRQASGQLTIAGVAGLLGLGVSAAARREQELTEQTKLERQYTAASLFSTLRSRLKYDLKAIRVLDGPADLEGLSPGALVEISGAITSDPVQRALTALTELANLASDVLAIQPLSSLLENVLAGQPGTKPMAEALGWAEPTAAAALVGPPNRGGRGQARPPARPQRRDRVQADQLAGQIAGFISRVTESAVRGAVTDYTIGTPDDRLVGVLTMSTEFLPPEAGLMLDSQMTVLGKVTTVLGDDNSIDLLRRSTLGYFPQEQVQRLLDWLDTTLRLSLPDVVVRGPGVQLLPLAVFV